MENAFCEYVGEERLVPGFPAGADLSWPAAFASQPPWQEQLPQQLAPGAPHPSLQADLQNPPAASGSEVSFLSFQGQQFEACRTIGSSSALHADP